MGLFQRWLTNRTLAKRLERANESPSVQTFADLARAAVASNDFEEAERMIDEGLDLFPSSNELDRLRRLVRQHRLADRIRELRRKIEFHPAPALYHELVDLQLQCNDTRAAEATCSDWRRMFPIDSGAELASIRILLARFYKDRAAADGRAAIAGLDRLLARDPGHARALRLMAELCSRIGALGRACEVLDNLAKIVPDDPEVEAWRRKVGQAMETAPSKTDLSRILREVEETGQFPDPVPPREDEEARKRKDVDKNKKPRVLDSARPALARLSKLAGVRLVIFVRGSAALVRGAPAGGAEPIARSTRAISIHAKRTTRRMGLGSFMDATIDTDLGSVVICCGDPSTASAVIDKSAPVAPVRAALSDLAAAPTPETNEVPDGAEGELVHA